MNRILENRHYTALQDFRYKGKSVTVRLKKYVKQPPEAQRLIVNQELHDSLYFCQTENVDNCDLAVKIPSEATDHYAELARECGVVIVTSMFERRAPGLYHNTAVVFEKDGSIAGIYRKMHIPDDPAYYEKFYFTPGDLGFMAVARYSPSQPCTALRGRGCRRNQTMGPLCQRHWRGAELPRLCDPIPTQE